MVIEIVDESEKIEIFFKLLKPYLELIRTGCLITCERADVYSSIKRVRKKSLALICKA